MNTIFISCESSKTSDTYRLLLNLTDKINLKKSDKYIPLSNFSMCYSWKNIKNKIQSETIHLKDQDQRGLKNLNSMMDHIIYHMFKIISVISPKHQI